MTPPPTVGGKFTGDTWAGTMKEKFREPSHRKISSWAAARRMNRRGGRERVMKRGTTLAFNTCTR